MGSVFTKSRLMTVGVTLLAIAAINQVSALEGVKKTINGDGGWWPF